MPVNYAYQTSNSPTLLDDGTNISAAISPAPGSVFLSDVFYAVAFNDLLGYYGVGDITATYGGVDMTKIAELTNDSLSYLSVFHLNRRPGGGSHGAVVTFQNWSGNGMSLAQSVIGFTGSNGYGAYQTGQGNGSTFTATVTKNDAKSMVVGFWCVSLLTVTTTCSVGAGEIERVNRIGQQGGASWRCRHMASTQAANGDGVMNYTLTSGTKHWVEVAVEVLEMPTSPDQGMMGMGI